MTAATTNGTTDDIRRQEGGRSYGYQVVDDCHAVTLVDEGERKLGTDTTTTDDDDMHGDYRTRLEAPAQLAPIRARLRSLFRARYISML